VLARGEHLAWAAASDGEGEMIIGPKHKDKQHHSFDEGTDEPPGLIDKESTDIETENPSDDTEPVEQVEEEDTEPPIFEE